MMIVRINKMQLSSQIKEKISVEVIKTLITRFESFPDPTFDFPAEKYQ